MGDTVTISVAPTPSKVSDLAKNLVGSLSVVLSDIDSRTATTTTTNANGTTSVKGGLLTGDSGVRSVRQQLIQAATYPVDGTSPSSVGIIIGRDGTVTFDEEKFAAAVTDDPVGTAAFVQALATRVQDAADGDVRPLRRLAHVSDHQPGIAGQGLRRADRGLGHSASNCAGPPCRRPTPRWKSRCPA